MNLSAQLLDGALPLMAGGALDGVLFAALCWALLVDHWLGEPPVQWHPVVWIGNYLGWIGMRIAPVLRSGASARPASLDNPAASRGWPFCAGAVAWCVGAAVVLTLAIVLQRFAFRWSWWAAALLLGLLLKPLLAWRMLRAEVLAVDAALAVSLDAGRAQLARLVSRDVRALTEAEVRESAIESLAENLNDSVVAPIFWFVLLGLPGAALYRFANTADAMWGYHGERNGRDWTWAGKWAARADDLLSWIPARLTAALLLASFAFCRRSIGAELRAPSFGMLRRQAAQTPSPNSGWPMAAMALLLGVRLGKPALYTLNQAGRRPLASDVQRAIRLCAGAVVLLALGLGAMLVLGRVLSSVLVAS